MKPKSAYLERVRGIVASGLRGYPADVFLFGSWARDEQRRVSDIDVAVLPRGTLPLALLPQLREDLEESDVPYPVDLVDLREVSPEFLARVLREGIRWSA